MANEDAKGVVGLRIPKAIQKKYPYVIKALSRMSEQLQLEGDLSELNWLLDVAGYYLSIPRPKLQKDYEIEEAMKTKGKPQ